MSSDVSLGSGPPETILPPASEEASAALSQAGGQRAEVAAVVRSHPTYLAAWATLGELTEREASSLAEEVEAYAYFRVGYHRGLDQLRKHGWRGSGYVRWEQASNRGFLRCLDGLRRMAGRLGEAEEEQRCEEFLAMLDPEWEPLA